MSTVVFDREVLLVFFECCIFLNHERTRINTNSNVSSMGPLARERGFQC